MSDRYIIAIYLADIAYGGPEEGGWWYDVGTLERLVEVERNEERAYEKCRHLNRLLNEHINSRRPSVSSVVSEGVYQAEVHRGNAPQFYPERRPHYE